MNIVEWFHRLIPTPGFSSGLSFSYKIYFANVVKQINLKLRNVMRYFSLFEIETHFLERKYCFFTRNIFIYNFKSTDFIR